jgi:hypothetical protein
MYVLYLCVYVSLFICVYLAIYKYSKCLVLLWPKFFSILILRDKDIRDTILNIDKCVYIVCMNLCIHMYIYVNKCICIHICTYIHSNI